MSKVKSRRTSVVRNARKLLRYLEEKKGKLSPLLILTHDYPDPDAIACALGLQYLAEKKFNITSRIVYGGIIGRPENKAMVKILKLPLHKLKENDFKKYHNTALVDTQPSFQNNSFPKKRKATMVIDQHPSDRKPLADFNIVDTECGATCVIIARAILMVCEEIPSRVATSMAYGILSDTLNLYRSPYAQVIDTYRDILPFCDMRALSRIQNKTRSRKFFATLANGIKKAKTKRRLIVSHLGEVETPELVAEIADFLLTCHGMDYSFCTGRYKGKMCASLRVTKSTLEAGEVLRDIFSNRGEAGGHGSIAGGSFEVGEGVDASIWQEMESVLAESLARRLRIPKKIEFTNPFRSK
jgi:nanoRNase/pAp phosphatase (c-di-AMP/oligoRNAs hydrolase)